MARGGGREEGEERVRVWYRHQQQAEVDRDGPLVMVAVAVAGC